MKAADRFVKAVLVSYCKLEPDDATVKSVAQQILDELGMAQISEEIFSVCNGPDTSDWTPASEWPFPLGVTPPEGWVSPGRRRALAREALQSRSSNDQGLDMKFQPALANSQRD